jgi:rhodanese-related sulfurtransferase
MDLTQEEWKSQLDTDDNAFLLDVRTLEEYNNGHIPNATLIDINQPQYFIDKILSLDNSKHYYVYCRSGARSSKACQIMVHYGIGVVKNLLGGFVDWEGKYV